MKIQLLLIKVMSTGNRAEISNKSQQKKQESLLDEGHIDRLEEQNKTNINMTDE